MKNLHLIYFTLPLFMGAMDLASYAHGQAKASASPADKNQSPAAILARNTKVSSIRQQVLANNPTLKTEEVNLLSQFESLKKPGPNVTVEARQAFHEKWVAHENNVRIQAIKIDPSVAPYF